MHLVHFNEAVGKSVSEAAGKDNGVAVVAVLFEMDPYEDQEEWTKGVIKHPRLDGVRLSTC